MGRTMIAVILMTGTLSSCADWRESPETVEACLARFAPKKGAVDLLGDDPGQWVPSYTYDITKMGGEGIRALVKTAEDGANPGTVGVILIGSGSSRTARDKFANIPVTEAGALLLADDPSLYKVRGKSGLNRDLLRQGCEAQRSGMRLISYRFTRADQLADGELPRSDPTSAQQREMMTIYDTPKIEDILP